MKEVWKRMKDTVSPAIIVVLITLGVVLFYAGFAAGSFSDQRAESVRFGQVIGQGDSYKSEDIDFDLFWEVWNLVSDSYVNQPVPEVDLFYGAVAGLVEGLNDPYSEFFNPEETEAFNQDLGGSFYGIGAEIGMRDDVIVVEAPLPNSPASKAGLLPGDIILAVDGAETFGWSVYETVEQIRGELGAPVILRILSESANEPRDVEIIRDEIVIDSVEWEIRDDGIAVISIFMFNEDTNRLFRQAAQEALSENAEGIIIDLRNNRGGLLDAVVRVSDAWIDDNIVTIERTNKDEFSLTTNPGAILEDIPTVVLVNGGSASASEILAGALQDYGLATIIGETTFGKGVVQEYREFSNGSAVKITIAEWFTPMGRAINEVGIEPDITVEFTVEDFDEQRTPQLDAAIDYLKGAR